MYTDKYGYPKKFKQAEAAGDRNEATLKLEMERKRRYHWTGLELSSSVLPLLG